MSPPPALETRRLFRSFGSLAATKDVSLAFEPGRRYAIIGPNGAGKTTYFNLLAGNLRPDSGQVLLDGRDVTRLDFAARARLGVGRSFQRNNLFLESTVRENLALALTVKRGGAGVFWRSLRRMPVMRTDAEEAAARVGLADAL
ncbi:MAG TPA: ATP-binding cassette domain-containing protein, partial [Beijerinckiaceae bacterium]